MTVIADGSCFKMLEGIRNACDEIKQVLNAHMEKTSNQQYRDDIEKDIVTLENLKLITIAVKEDIETERIGSCTELLLRIAANEFKNKLSTIPDKRTTVKDIISAIIEVHRAVLLRSIRNTP